MFEVDISALAEEVAALVKGVPTELGYNVLYNLLSNMLNYIPHLIDYLIGKGLRAWESRTCALRLMYPHFPPEQYHARSQVFQTVRT